MQGKMRGQAFETMMLVISVIVALAILAVLLNILNIVKIFNPSNPTDVMSSGLKDIQSQGVGITQPQKVTFSQGTRIVRSQLITDIPIQSTAITFVCDDTANVCGNGKPLEIETSTGILLVNNNIEVYLSVCGAQQKYCIAMASTASDATKSCATKCNVQ